MGEKRGDDAMRRQLGISRRDLLKRGAVVGGTLIWAAPAIQSLTPAAYAQSTGQSPGECAACYCWNGDKQNPSVGPGGGRDFCTSNGPSGFQQNEDACEAWCKHIRGSPQAPGGPYEFNEYCSGGDPCDCNDRTDPGTNGVDCT